MRMFTLMNKTSRKEGGFCRVFADTPERAIDLAMQHTPGGYVFARRRENAKIVSFVDCPPTFQYEGRASKQLSPDPGWDATILVDGQWIHQRQEGVGRGW